jgi:hypothetical protein
MKSPIQNFNNERSNPNEDLIMEITMSVVFAAIIVFSVLVFLGV